MFSKTQEGAEQFNKITAGIGATINVVIDRISMLGKAITLVFRGEFTEAANLAAEAVRGVGDEIERGDKARHRPRRSHRSARKEGGGDDTHLGKKKGADRRFKACR